MPCASWLHRIWWLYPEKRGLQFGFEGTKFGGDVLPAKVCPQEWDAGDVIVGFNMSFHMPWRSS